MFELLDRMKAQEGHKGKTIVFRICQFTLLTICQFELAISSSNWQKRRNPLWRNNTVVIPTILAVDLPVI